MDSADLHARLLEEARRYDPTRHGRGRLGPYRDVLLVWRAKSVSYEKIAAFLSKEGVTVSPAGVGAYCRRTFSMAEILREQARIRTGSPNVPAATALSFGLSAVASPVLAPLPHGRRGPKIARDDY